MEGGGNGETPALTRRRLLQYGAGALGAASLGGLLAACGGDETAAQDTTSGAPSRGGTAKLGFSDAFSTDTLDPITTLSMWGGMGKGAVYDQLVYSDLDWNLTPMLAEDWASNTDASEWTFKLRKGVEFHSGKTLTTKDVAYTFGRNVNEKTGGGAYPIFAPILDAQGIKPSDDTTIVFSLRQPDAFFPNKVAYFFGHIYEDGTAFDQLAAGQSPGTGPFKATRWAPEGWEMVRNENYWQNGRPYLAGLSGVVITELATKTQSVISGDTHLIDPVDWSAIDPIEGSEDVEILANERGAAFLFGIDGTAKPYTDLRVVQAAKMLVDRDKFVEVVCRGDATASADSCIHPDDPFYPSDLEPVPYDPEQAKALLAEAGYPDGYAETIFTSDFGPATLNGPLLLKEQWQAGGINAEVSTQSYDQLFTKNWLVDKVVTNYWWRQHPSTMLPFMYSCDGVWNESRFCDNQLDQMILAAQSTIDVDKQKGIISDILHTYNDKASSIWPAHIYFNFPHKKQLQGLVAQPTYQIDLRNAYLST
jgi:peptide/nickel transport system substrate-binding protein